MVVGCSWRNVLLGEVICFLFFVFFVWKGKGKRKIRGELMGDWILCSCLKVQLSEYWRLVFFT